MDVFFLVNGIFAIYDIYHRVCSHFRPNFTVKEDIEEKLERISERLERLHHVLPPEYSEQIKAGKAAPTITGIDTALDKHVIEELQNICSDTFADATSVLHYVKENVPNEELLSNLAAVLKENPVFRKHYDSYVSVSAQKKSLFRLDGVQGPAQGMMLLVAEGEEMKIGSDSAIRLTDYMVSPEHCRVWNDQGSLHLEDLHSEHGTFVNLLRIAAPVLLQPGDSVIIGQSFLNVVSLKEKEAVRPQPVGQCKNCNRPLIQHAIDRHRVIQRQGVYYCMRCICDKGAGDFPTVGKYRILHRLGKGAMADVYLAVQTSMYRLVAFKWLKNMKDPTPDKIRRFTKERDIGARLNHPNVVQFYDAGHENNVYFISMEFVQGKTLDELLKDKGHLGEKEVVSIAFQLVEALDFACREHIVHRDLKPSNVFVANSGIVKLSDFGLAKYFDEAGLSAAETASGTSMGTLAYMPPEQFGDAKYADQRADIYSLGATMYTLLTGRTPIATEGITVPQYVNRLYNQAPVPPSQVIPEIPQALEKIVMKCLEKKREDRYQTPAEIRTALRALK